MKIKNILKKGISVLLVISLLIGLHSTGTMVKAETEEETNPWDGYTRITMQNYGITASVDEAGTTYNYSVSGKYTGTSLNQTYLDVDVNFNGTFDTSNYFHYFGSDDWVDTIRFTPDANSMGIQDQATRAATDIWVTHTDYEISASAFFNVKILTDIVTNVDDVTKEDVTIQVYLNEKLAGTMTWTEVAGQNHDNFYFYLGKSGSSYTLRTPILEGEEIVQPWSDYTRITMQNYDIIASTNEGGTTYTSPVSGEYTGTSLNHTYLDVDVNFNGTVTGANYFHYFGSGDWVDNIRIIPYSTGISVKDIGGRNTTTPIEPWIPCTTSGFINVKILTDITTNEADATKEDITLQFYINNSYAAQMTWTEVAGQDHNNFYFWLKSGSFTLRTPTVEGEVVVDPWAKYTRVTLKDYGVIASTREAGTIYDSSVSGTYTGTSLNQTYLDVDVNFNGIFTGSNYFHYFGSGDWDNNVRIIPASTSITIRDMGGRAGSDLAPTNINYGVSANKFFNLKILTNIVTNTSDSAKEDVTLRYYINEEYVGKMTWTEDAGQNHNNFYFCLGKSGSTYALRTPVIEGEAIVDPWMGYTRITMEDYGVIASNREAGTTYTASKSGTYIGESLNKTYLDVDINFNGTFDTSNYFHYFGSADWNGNIRIIPSATGITMKDAGGRGVSDVWIKHVNCDTSADEFFNLKVMTDIVVNSTDTTKEDVILQFYINEEYVGKMTWTETAGQNHNNFYFYCGSGSFSLRTPDADGVVRIVPWEDYTRVTMEDYGITASTDDEGTIYRKSVTGTYTGTSLNHTYLDVDMNFNGTFDGTNFFEYFGSGEWVNNIRFSPTTDNKIHIKDWYQSSPEVYAERADEIYTLNTDNHITASEFFNLKILVDIVENPDDPTKEDVMLRYYMNEHYSGTMTWTEAAGQNHDNFYFYCETGSFALRTPTLKPWSGYKRLVMNDYGITAAAIDAGTNYTSSVSGTYTGTSMNHTYLDVDINFNGAVKADEITNYFHFFGSADWDNNLRFIPYIAGMSLQDIGGRYAEEPWFDFEAYGISADEFFNVKILTDIVTDSADSTKEDVTLQVYLNEQLANTITWTEDAEQNHNNFYFYCTSGSFALRTPTDKVAKPDVTYELKSGEGYLLIKSGDIYVDDVKQTVGTAITSPGDYVVKNVEDFEATYIQNVSLYKVGDVNLDGGATWTKADQSALEGILADGTLSKAAMKAADINNDGKVAESDLELMKQVVNGTVTKDTVLDKYHVPAVTYDFLGGDSVMPIGGYFGPYSEDSVSESIYKWIADSGVNFIASSEINYSDSNSRDLIEQGLELAEKYGIGVYVSDARLNSVTTDDLDLVTEHSCVSNPAEMAALLADYSRYESFLGTTIMDEPVTDSGFGYLASNHVQRFKYYETLTTMMNHYDNMTGYVNLLGAYHMNSELSFENYLKGMGETMKLLSFDSYPFYEEAGGVTYYLQSLGTVSKVAREEGYPFWAYTMAGTDHRDDGAAGATTEYLTEAQTLWNVNTALAFGAKGLVYFPLLQPSYYSHDGSANGENDYDRNGIIGANNEKNMYYDYVQNANEQVAAVDEVLMKAENQGVIATGQAATDVSGFDSIITSTAKLKSVSGDDAMVGCFTYQDTEAYYAMSYDYEATSDQTITLNFAGNYQYRIIQDANTSYGEGSSCTFTIPAGAGVLVVLEDQVVYYNDISQYRTEGNYTAPEAPAGYIFAGWFSDKTCTTPIEKNTTSNGAYAKFVDANLLTVKAQISVGITEESELSSIRFLTSVNSLDYSKVGFKINIHKDTGVDRRDYSSRIVYKTLSAHLGNETVTKTPKIFCHTATYFKAQVIQKIPKDSFDTPFEVTPYWVTLDGTTVYGPTSVKTVQQGIGQEGY